jgi:hypothetical protein
MQYDRHKFGDFLAVAGGLRLASLPGRILTLDPAPCGTSYSAAAEERRGFRASDANHNECGLEVDLASKHGQVPPPPAKNKKPIPELVVKVLGT